MRLISRSLRGPAETAETASSRGERTACPVDAFVDGMAPLPRTVQKRDWLSRARRTAVDGRGKPLQLHLNDCTKLLMSLSNSGSRLRMVSIFRTEWMTVE